MHNKILDILKKSEKLTLLSLQSPDVALIKSAYKACVKANAIFVIDLRTAYYLDSIRKTSKEVPRFNWENVKIKFLKEDIDLLKKEIPVPLFYFYNKNKIDVFGIRKRKNKILMLISDDTKFSRVFKEMGNVEGSIIICTAGEKFSERFTELCVKKGLIPERI